MSKSRNFHEQLDRSEHPLPSDRSTGLIFAGVAVLLAYFRRHDEAAPVIALGAAAVFAVVALVAPILLRPLNIVWMRLALVISKIMNPIVMLVLFLVAIVPAGLIMQVRGDPLQRRRRESQSYWIPRKGEGRSSMSNQF